MDDDDDRLASCHREISRLRGVVRCMEAASRQYEQLLKEEIEKDSSNLLPGLKKAIELWQEIQKEL